jgi:type VI protein secretion system component VasK
LEPAMANARKAASEAPAVDTSRILAKALPEEARLSGRNRFFLRNRWLVWLGVALVLLAALLWGMVTYLES